MDRLAPNRIVSSASRGPSAPTLEGAPGPRLERYLLGRGQAEGLFQDFTGKVRRRFSIDITGQMDGETLVADESFLFDDGEIDKRRWRITPASAGAYNASADDMLEEAHGEVRGGVLRWSYLFSLQIGAQRWRVRFHDSFVELANGTLLNQARITKFGAPIGTTTIVFESASR